MRSAAFWSYYVSNRAIVGSDYPMLWVHKFYGMSGIGLSYFITKQVSIDLDVLAGFAISNPIQNDAPDIFYNNIGITYYFIKKSKSSN